MGKIIFYTVTGIEDEKALFYKHISRYDVNKAFSEMDPAQVHCLMYHPLIRHYLKHVELAEYLGNGILRSHQPFSKNKMFFMSGVSGGLQLLLLILRGPAFVGAQQVYSTGYVGDNIWYYFFSACAMSEHDTPMLLTTAPTILDGTFKIDAEIVSDKYPSDGIHTILDLRIYCENIRSPELVALYKQDKLKHRTNLDLARRIHPTIIEVRPDMFTSEDWEIFKNAPDLYSS